MYTPHDFTTTDNLSTTNLSPTCFVTPKATGVASLGLQFTLLIVSVLVVLFFFYHVGGHECSNWDEKLITFESISYTEPLDSSASYSEPSSAQESSMDNAFLEDNRVPGTHTESTATSNCSNLFNVEQMLNTTTYLDIWGFRLNVFELIHMSTLIYIGISVLWLISILLLLFTMRFRVLDMVFTNAMFLTLAATYAFMHALLVVVLLHNQLLVSWQTMAIVIGCAVTLICITILCTIALSLVVAWYRYIVSMSNTKCFCCYGIMSLVKKFKSEPQRSAQDYAMPDVTRHSQLPYNDDRVQSFTAF